MKLYNDQLNAQFLNVFYLSIYFCLTCFGLSFSPYSEAGVQLRHWFKSLGYGVSARVRMEQKNVYISIHHSAKPIHPLKRWG
jgi:hypothetical protein